MITLGGERRWPLAGGRQATPTALSTPRTRATPPWQQQFGGEEFKRPEPCVILTISCSIELFSTFEHIIRIKVRVLLSVGVQEHEVADPHAPAGHSFTQHLDSFYSQNEPFVPQLFMIQTLQCERRELWREKCPFWQTHSSAPDDHSWTGGLNSCRDFRCRLICWVFLFFQSVPIPAWIIQIVIHLLCRFNAGSDCCM